MGLSLIQDHLQERRTRVNLPRQLRKRIADFPRRFLELVGDAKCVLQKRTKKLATLVMPARLTYAPIIAFRIAKIVAVP